MGYLQPPEKYSRWQQILPKMAYRSTGRSTGQRSDLTAGTSRSTARSTEKNREHCSQFRSTGPLDCQTCTALCTSVDRPLVRSTDLACQPVLGLINRIKVILKLLVNLVEILKNSFNHFALIYKHVIKFSTQISCNQNYFCVLSFLPKIKLVFYQTCIFQHMNRKVKISLSKKFKHACIERIRLLYI